MSSTTRLGVFHRSMVVAVIAVRVVEVAVDDVVDVVAVRDRLVTTTGAVHVIFVVTSAAVSRCTAVGVCVGHIESMFVYMVPVGVVEVAIMQIVDVVAVFNGGVSTVWSMHMCVVWMFVACVIRIAHFDSFMVVV